MPLLPTLSLALALAACSAPAPSPAAADPPPAATAPAEAAPAAPAVSDSPTPTVTGAQRLVDSRFEALDGMRVGLVTNHTARVSTADGGPEHLIDRVHAAPNVVLGALFGPEHGLRGTAEAGASVSGGRDASTGVPVHSLYGPTKKPSQRQLAGLDALVFDMQDIGARFYTYISTMAYAMEAAAEAGIPFVVLDRPNPIGGRVEGPVMPPAHESFVGLLPIPITHGMTVGELARMIVGEQMRPGVAGLDLRVVQVEGWTRATPWEATGLDWIAPSPNIPDVETARVYPGTALFEGTRASEGRGTRTPFVLVGAEDIDAEAVADDLNGRGLAGVRFAADAFTPVDLPGQATNPKGEGRRLGGIRLHVTDPGAFRPVAVGAHVVDAVYHAAPARRFFKPDWLAKLAGTTALPDAIRGDLDALLARWGAEADAFEAARAPYLVYE